MRALAWWMVGLCCVSAACGGSVENPSGSSTGSSSGGTDAGASLCPATEPAGGSCAGVPEAFRCTYGDSPRPECRHEWLCTSGTWTTTKSVCVEPPPDHCMFQMPPGGQMCSTEGDVCIIDTATICLCTSCAGPCMPPAKWLCTPPPMTQGCPQIVPNDGTPCEQAGLVCNYGNICTVSGAQVKCENGLWMWNQLVACPG